MLTNWPARGKSYWTSRLWQPIAHFRQGVTRVPVQPLLHMRAILPGKGSLILAYDSNEGLPTIFTMGPLDLSLSTRINASARALTTTWRWQFADSVHSILLSSKP